MTDDSRKAAPALVTTVAPTSRDQAIERLQDHYAHSQLDVEDFERLVELAERAKSNRELERLFEGLPPLPAADTSLVRAATTTPGSITATVKATLGATTRRGRWKVPHHVKVRAFMGSVDIDLFDADLDAGETLIEVSAVMGSITIVVPEGLAVSCEGSVLLGSFDHIEQSAASRRDKRVVRIAGGATLGSVEVIVKPRDPTSVVDDVKRFVRGLLGP